MLNLITGHMILKCEGFDRCCDVQAVERGQGSGDKWEDYRARLLQAEADALSFKAALDQVVQRQQVSLQFVIAFQAL